MKTQPPSVLKRQALRAAIRQHPDAETHLNGRRVNSLQTHELNAIAEALGLDADLVTTTTTDMDDDDATTTTTTTTTTTDETTLDVDAEIAAIRDLVVNGGFNAADPKLRKLINDANKPARVVEIEVPTTTATTTNGATVTHAKPTTIERTWSQLFGVKGPMGQKTCHLWDGAHPQTPAIDNDYVWQQPCTAIALSQIARQRNVFLFGPPGTGKTTWANQLAATLGRPFVLISCDDQTDAPTLIGMTVPSRDGGTQWQDGILTRAIRTPGAIICIDEPSVARAGALMALQNILAHRVLYIAETGETVRVARGVIFICADNTNGTGNGASHGYAGTGRLNGAFLDRFGVFLEFGYLTAAKEAVTIMHKTKCPRALADLLVGAATTTRQAANAGTITNGISLRRLFAWAELLCDGVAPRAAFDAAVINGAPERDKESLTQQCVLTYDTAQVAAALDPNAARNMDPNNTTDEV